MRMDMPEDIKTCWATLFPEGNWNMRPRPNSDGERIKMLNEGQRHGKYWIPAECDFSLKGVLLIILQIA